MSVKEFPFTNTYLYKLMTFAKYSLFENNDDTLSLNLSINHLLQKTSDSVNKVDIAALFFA